MLTGHRELELAASRRQLDQAVAEDRLPLEGHQGQALAGAVDQLQSQGAPHLGALGVGQEAQLDRVVVPRHLEGGARQHGVPEAVDPLRAQHVLAPFQEGQGGVRSAVLLVGGELALLHGNLAQGAPGAGLVAQDLQGHLPRQTLAGGGLRLELHLDRVPGDHHRVARGQARAVAVGREPDRPLTAHSLLGQGGGEEQGLLVQEVPRPEAQLHASLGVGALLHHATVGEQALQGAAHHRLAVVVGRPGDHHHLLAAVVDLALRLQRDLHLAQLVLRHLEAPRHVGQVGSGELDGVVAERRLGGQVELAVHRAELGEGQLLAVQRAAVGIAHQGVHPRAGGEVVGALLHRAHDRAPAHPVAGAVGAAVGRDVPPGGETLGDRKAGEAHAVGGVVPVAHRQHAELGPFRQLLEAAAGDPVLAGLELQEQGRLLWARQGEQHAHVLCGNAPRDVLGEDQHLAPRALQDHVDVAADHQGGRPQLVRGDRHRPDPGALHRQLHLPLEGGVLAVVVDLHLEPLIGRDQVQVELLHPLVGEVLLEVGLEIEGVERHLHRLHVAQVQFHLRRLLAAPGALGEEHQARLRHARQPRPRPVRPAAPRLGAAAVGLDRGLELVQLRLLHQRGAEEGAGGLLAARVAADDPRPLVDRLAQERSHLRLGILATLRLGLFEVEPSEVLFEPGGAPVEG